MWRQNWAPQLRNRHYKPKKTGSGGLNVPAEVTKNHSVSGAERGAAGEPRLTPGDAQASSLAGSSS